jgi:hypothetical protein
MTQQKRFETKGSRKSLEMAKRAWQFIRSDYQAGHEHKKNGKPVVWSCSLVEKDLFYAMGLHPFYPEQFASLCAVRRKTRDSEKEAVRFARMAEQAGYSADLCGYERVATGYILGGDLSDAPLDGMALPDLLVTTSTGCDVRLKWFEDMARRLKVPLVTLDRPERVYEAIMQPPKSHEIRYYRSQIEDLLDLITEVTGTRYDPERLNECLDWSYKTNELRLEILELRKAVPSPMGCADGFATMYPGMYCSGTCAMKSEPGWTRARGRLKTKNFDCCGMAFPPGSIWVSSIISKPSEGSLHMKRHTIPIPGRPDFITIP